MLYVTVGEENCAFSAEKAQRRETLLPRVSSAKPRRPVGGPARVVQNLEFVNSDRSSL